MCRHYLLTRDINIINHSAFNDFNTVFVAKSVELKRQGLAKDGHKHTKHLKPSSEYLFQ